MHLPEEPLRLLETPLERSVSAGAWFVAIMMVGGPELLVERVDRAADLVRLLEPSGHPEGARR